MIDSMHYPLVSVVVPIYNMERFLAETLDSILLTDYPNYEIILFDDGSSDDSYAIAERYAEKSAHIKLFRHDNAGASATRNAAIDCARGEYILPVDADNMIEPNFVSAAVEMIHGHEEVKLVVPRSEFFGDRTGEWFLKNYSLKLLARKNIIDNCAMYRKADWQRVGGYCSDIPTREDWDFWISLLKNGGSVAKLDFIAHHYRVRSDSKRVKNRSKKFAVIDKLNERHLEMFFNLFRGPLRHRRSWSLVINILDNIFNHRAVVVNPHLPNFTFSYNYGANSTSIYQQMDMLYVRFRTDWGRVIHALRNELRLVEIGGTKCVVKSYAVPNVVNRLAYGVVRQSKAERAYRNALLLLKSGIDTPLPVGYSTRRVGLMLKESFFVSQASSYRLTFNDIINDADLPRRNEYLAFVGEMTARLHEAGFLPLDYSGGNILLDEIDGEFKYQLIDLNRMRFTKIDVELGCRGFERLNVEPAALDIMAKSYANYRQFDADVCVELIRKYRWKKHLIK